MLRPGIKSRPVYSNFTADIKAKHNLIAVEGEGAGALLDMAGKVDSGFFDRATILYCPTDTADKADEVKLAQLKPQKLWILPSLETAMFRLYGALENANVNTRLYAAGTEPFIGSVIKIAGERGIDFKSVITEHRGSAKRRVQCVHCKGSTENVTTSIVVCAHCGLKLFVRDHYSRRLAAFQGVCVDAEVPGEVPPVEDIYK